MDAQSIQELNKVRRAMGMKELPVPGAAPAETKDEETDDEDAPSTLESREAKAYGNFKKVQDEKAAKKRREEQAAAIRKARDKAQRVAVLDGKGLGDLDDDDGNVKSWIKNSKKRQKQIEKTRKQQEEQEAADAAAAAEHTSNDLAGVKVGHDMASLLDGDDQILTLKDTAVLDSEEEGDELENVALREHEKLQERLNLKKKKPVYDPNDVDETGEGSILQQYDVEISGKKKKFFTLNAGGASTDLADILDAPVQKRKFQTVDLGILDDAPAAVSDYLDASEVKVKKPKKKKAKSTRQRAVDDDDVLFSADTPAADADASMDIDSGANFTKKRKIAEDNFDDDDDLQASLALQRREALKKRKKMRPEDLARQLREEASQSPEPEGGDKGMVLDEISGFVDTLQKSNDDDDRRLRTKVKQEKSGTAVGGESSDEDEDMKDAASIKEESVDLESEEQGDLTAQGVEEEKTIGQGMGSALALLRERGLLSQDQNGGELNEKFRKRQLFIAELNRRMAEFDEEARQQRERDRASGRLDRMTTKDREEWQRNQNNMRELHQSRVTDQLYRQGYTPSVELKYIDKYGRRLDQKEAFKELSHGFHGKTSGKGKTEKLLKKIEDEKRRNAQSTLDASQNVGMSSAATQQGRKRREAGVRLA